MLTFTVVLDPETEGGYAVTAAALSEVVSYGDTREGALRHVSEAIQLALEVRGERGEPIPTDVEPIIEHVHVAI